MSRQLAAVPIHDDVSGRSYAHGEAVYMIRVPQTIIIDVPVNFGCNALITVVCLITFCRLLCLQCDCGFHGQMITSVFHIIRQNCAPYCTILQLIRDEHVIT